MEPDINMANVADPLLVPDIFDDHPPSIWDLRDPISGLPMPTLLPPSPVFLTPPQPPRSIPLSANLVPNPLQQGIEQQIRLENQLQQGLVRAQQNLQVFPLVPLASVPLQTPPVLPASTTTSSSVFNSLPPLGRHSEQSTLPSLPSLVGAAGFPASAALLPYQPISPRTPSAPCSLSDYFRALNDFSSPSIHHPVPFALGSFPSRQTPNLPSPAPYPPVSGNRSTGLNVSIPSSSTSSASQISSSVGTSTSANSDPPEPTNIEHKNNLSNIFPPSSPTDNIMPTTRKRTAAAATRADNAPAPKRRQAAAVSAKSPVASRKRKEPPKADLDEMFGESGGEEEEEEVLDVIDLADTEELPADISIPQKDERVKLSAFQCVICMDDATSLTVTHCGHLFCAQCLHSSLNIDAMKNKCPICRQKIETRNRSSYNAKTKGFWPLELKLMTARRKGKQAAKQ